MNKKVKKTLMHLTGEIITGIIVCMIFNMLGWWPLLGAFVGFALYWLIIAMLKADWSHVVNYDFDSD